eukprot:m.180321 g.180321  ORF g.180321 m.180321 type:complete len:78 (+) comp15497_c0_seq2:1863-2096(+)
MRYFSITSVCWAERGDAYNASILCFNNNTVEVSIGNIECFEWLSSLRFPFQLCFQLHNFLFQYIVFLFDLKMKLYFL